MNLIHKYLLLVFLLVTLFSCNKEVQPAVLFTKGRTTIQIVDEGIYTKNGITPSTESITGDIIYVLFNDEDSYVLHAPSTDPIDITAYDNGYYWDVFAFTNCSGLLPEDDDELRTMCYDGYLMFENVHTVRDYIPMFGSVTIAEYDFGYNNKVRMSRLMSKINFRYDSSACDANSYIITNITFRQCCDCISPWSAPQRNCGFDFTPSSFNASAVNAGIEQAYYVPENRAGTCYAISSPWDKTKTFLATQPGGSTIANNATYMEISTLFTCSSKGMVNTPVTFRFFLGQNDTNSFNLTRNYAYSIIFRPTDTSAFVKNNWKVDAGSGEDVDIDIDIPIGGGDIIIN